MLFRKMLRDMKLNKTQFLSILIMTILGVFIYAGVSSEYNGLQKTVDKYYEDTNFADAWLYSKGFTEETAEAIAEIDGITGVERRLTLESIADFDHKPTLKLHFVEDNKISTFLVLEGEEFDINKDGIWLDNEFAKAVGLKTGDSITLTTGGYTVEKVIKGLIISPEYIYAAGEDDILPIRKNYGYGFLSYQEFPAEIPIFYTDLLITMDNSMDFDPEEEIDKAIEGKYSIYLPRKDLVSHLRFSEEIEEHKAMGRVFPIAFVAVALLTIVTTMARMVNNQRTQIGILKAMGFRRRRILFHYISYGLWISLVGSVIGTLLGPIIIPYLFFEPLKTAFTLPIWQSATPLSAVLMAAFCVVSCTLVTYLTCRKVLVDTPSESLRPKAPKGVKHSFFDRLKLWRKLSFHTQWNLRDVFRCKGRSTMAIVGVIGCTALLICSFGMQDTFDYFLNWSFSKLNRYETKIELEEHSQSTDVHDIMKQYQGEAISESAIELKANGIKRSGELLVLDNVSLIDFVNPDREDILLPEDQISISYKMSELLDVEIGDQVSWHIYGEEKWNDAIVGAIYRTPFSQGATMTRELYEVYGYEFQPTAILSSMDLSEEIKEEKMEGVSKIYSKKMLMESYYGMMEAMNILIYILMLAAVILAVVVIYNLGVLAFTERQRELSTLKVVGFKTRTLRTLLLKQNIWLTVAGIIPGLPIGIWTLKYIFRFVGELFDFIIVIDFTSYLFSIIGTMLVSILVNRLFSKRVKNIDMVSSLKGVE